jgi:hydrogenase-4 component B
VNARWLPAAAHWMHLDGVLLVVAVWLLIGVAGIFALRRLRFVARLLFPLGGAVARGRGVADRAARSALPFRLDSLSAFFLMIIGSVSAGVSAFAAGYFRKGEGTPPGLLALEYHVFLASMALVVLADDAYAFMVMWETMALSSFFLVTANHRIVEIQRAGYLYLLIAHVGAIGILLCFGILQANTGDYTFANMRAQACLPFWASLAFLLALFGFGAKAGIVPLHVWLPEAHPAAPSPVSALMSGVMLKTAIYGVLRVVFDLLRYAALVVGFAAAGGWPGDRPVRRRLRRRAGRYEAPAGLLVDREHWFAVHRHRPGRVVLGLRTCPMAALALTAVLYHVASHAFFKSLLFVGTGAVLHATGERNLGKLGGLIRTCPGWPGSPWSAFWPAPVCRRSVALSRSGCCCRAFSSRRICRVPSSTC